MIESFVEEYADPPELPEDTRQLLVLVRQYMSVPEVEQVEQALQLAVAKCHNVVGERSIPPLEHALAISTILAQMHIDAVGISSGLVFEAVDAGLLSLEQVERELGVMTARVVGSMERLNILERKKQSMTDPGASFPAISGENKKPRIRKALRRQQAETVRKMFVGMAEDPRVVMLKLAYRLHAMRMTCKSSYSGDPQEEMAMAQETREIYAPLAGRLGMSRVESELEDLAFQILEPEHSEWVRNIIELESKQWRAYVERVCVILRTEMASLGVKAEVSGRVKHLYSFYKKLVRNVEEEDFIRLKGAVDVNQIHDLIAFRILVDSTPDCYIALGHVHSLWRPKEGRIKDFIANPKPNGYRALHTTVFCLDDQLVEIQIRTHAMHEMAEYGVAMHWHYKDVGDNASASARELQAWLHQLGEWQHEIRTWNASDTEFIEAVKDDLFEEQIFVFTPKGEVKDLPVSSTPLDFAYRIHSKIGDSCAGVRIITGDGDHLVTKMVPLDYELKSGEIIEIITNRTAHPTRDWLNFARTAAARSKIRRYLKQHERGINIQIGRERLDRELKMVCARTLDTVTEDAEKWLCEELHQEKFEDLLTAVGADDMRPHALVMKLIEYWQQREGKEGKETKDREAGDTLTLPGVSAKQVTSAQFQVAGVNGLLTKQANCCCPLPGDEIIGFISRGRGVIVHRADCQNIAIFRKRDHERLIHVSWAGMNQSRYLAPIVIIARDRAGLLRDIAAIISDLGINLVSVNTHSGGAARVLIAATLEIYDLEQMQRIFTRLEKVRDVFHVARDLEKR